MKFSFSLYLDNNPNVHLDGTSLFACMVICLLYKVSAPIRDLISTWYLRWGSVFIIHRSHGKTLL